MFVVTYNMCFCIHTSTLATATISVGLCADIFTVEKSNQINQSINQLCSSVQMIFSRKVTCTYGVVAKGLLTFLGSFYKEVAKTTPGTLVYHFERQTARRNISSFQKHCVFNLECRILSQEPSHSFILYFKVIFHGK